MVFKTKADHVRFHNGCKAVKTEDGSYIAVYHEEHKNPHICPLCGGSKSKGAKICIVCERKRLHKEHPPKELLDGLVHKYSFAAVGKMYDVSPTSIRKWCKEEGIPYRRMDM